MNNSASKTDASALRSPMHKPVHGHVPGMLEMDSHSGSKPASPVAPVLGKSSRGRGQGGTPERGQYFGETLSAHELQNQYADLQQKYELKGLDHEKLHKEHKKKNESYLRREVFYKSEISKIKENLEQTVLCRGGDDVSMPRIRKMHTEIVKNIDEMQTRTKRIVEDHERDLLRQFRSKIVEVEGKLKKEQYKHQDVAGVPRAWIERTTKLSKEVDKHKEQAIRLDRINEVLNRNIEKYRAECKVQEDDREFLVRQLVTIKKENARLRREIEKLSSGTPSLSGAPVPARVRSSMGRVSQLRGELASAAAARPSTSHSQQDGVQELRRYQEVHDRLKKLLETERKQTREARNAHLHLLTNRTELEGMLRECVDQIKAEGGLSVNTQDAHQGSQKEDRERVLEMLLSQERAVALLYGTTKPSSANRVDPAQNRFDFSKNHLIAEHEMTPRWSSETTHSDGRLFAEEPSFHAGSGPLDLVQKPSKPIAIPWEHELEDVEDGDNVDEIAQPLNEI